jgi:Icc-related predicted phosphoesterase
MGRPLRWFVFVLLLAGCYPKGWVGANAEFQHPHDFPFRVGPYLVPVAQGHIAVVVNDDHDDPPVIEWWVETASTATAAAAPQTRRVQSTKLNGLWIATLENLPPDVPLAYRVHCEESLTRPVGPFSFKAGVSRGQRFRFAAFGDTRTGHIVHRALIEAMSRERIDFVINSGDLVEFGGTEEQWELFFRIEAPLIASRPVLAAIGNHDVSPRRYFEKYFLSQMVSSGNRYYHVDWGDVRVVIMDSETEARPGSDQYAFLERTLREGAAKDMLMIMSLHYPPYSSGEHGSNLEMREVVGELAPRYGVELVLAGHDHDYERTEAIDGVTYIVAASAGATIRKLSPSKFSKVLRTEPHFVLFDADRGSLVGRTINLAGNTFDSFVIEPNPPR